MVLKLTVEYKVGSSRDELVINGPLSEETESSLSAVTLPASMKRDVVLDLAGIKHVNSIGIRDWIPFVQKLEKSHKLVLRRCSPTFVMACNVVQAMKGNAHVESVSRGYECPNRHYFWVDVPLGFAKKQTDEKIPCEQCGLKAAPEYDSDEYFRFLD